MYVLVLIGNHGEGVMMAVVVMTVMVVVMIVINTEQRQRTNLAIYPTTPTRRNIYHSQGMRLENDTLS